MARREEAESVTRLRAAIKASGRTQYRVAADAGIDHKQVQRFLSGRSGIGFDLGVRLANAVGYRLDPIPGVEE